MQGNGWKQIGQSGCKAKWVWETHSKRASMIAVRILRDTVWGSAAREYSGYSLVEVFHG